MGLTRAQGRYNKQRYGGRRQTEDYSRWPGRSGKHFYKITLPWSDEGFRLLPAELYFDLMARMRRVRSWLRAGRGRSFLSRISQYIEQCGRS